MRELLYYITDYKILNNIYNYIDNIDIHNIY